MLQSKSRKKITTKYFCQKIHFKMQSKKIHNVFTIYYTWFTRSDWEKKWFADDLMILTRMMDVNFIKVFIICTKCAGFIIGMVFDLRQTHSQTVFAVDNIVWCCGRSWNWRHNFFLFFVFLLLNFIKNLFNSFDFSICSYFCSFLQEFSICFCSVFCINNEKVSNVVIFSFHVDINTITSIRWEISSNFVLQMIEHFSPYFFTWCFSLLN